MSAAYSADTFVADEQPTTAKWNKLWANDAAMNDGTGIFGLYKNLLAVDSNPYKFSAYHNTTQAVGNGSFANLSFNTEDFDTNGNFSSSTYTAPVNGFYMFGYNLRAAVTIQRLEAGIAVGGTLVQRSTVFDDDNQSAGGSVGSKLIQLTASDTVRVQGLGNSAYNLEAGQAQTNFWGFLVCRT